MYSTFIPEIQGVPVPGTKSLMLGVQEAKLWLCVVASWPRRQGDNCPLKCLTVGKLSKVFLKKNFCPNMQNLGLQNPHFKNKFKGTIEILGTGHILEWKPTIPPTSQSKVDAPNSRTVIRHWDQLQWVGSRNQLTRTRSGKYCISAVTISTTALCIVLSKCFWNTESVYRQARWHIVKRVRTAHKLKSNSVSSMSTNSSYVERWRRWNCRLAVIASYLQRYRPALLLPLQQVASTIDAIHRVHRECRRQQCLDGPRVQPGDLPMALW